MLLNALDRHRSLLLEMYSAALVATNGRRLIVDHSAVNNDCWTFQRNGVCIEVPLPHSVDRGQVIVVGAGKAAASLGAGLEQVLGNRLSRGVLIVKYGHSDKLTKLRTIEAGHPVPDAAGVAGTLAVLEEMQVVGPGDTVFVLLTGGASSLLVQPAADIQLEDKIGVTNALLRVGADIGEINMVRKHLSSVKGGGLAKAMNGARFCTLIISDVIGDDIATIASGPTVSDPTTYGDAWKVLVDYGLSDRVPQRVIDHLQRGRWGLVPETAKPGTWDETRGHHVVLANNASALNAIAVRASDLGMNAIVLPDPLVGDAHHAAKAMAEMILQCRGRGSVSSAPTVIVAGGETTLAVTGNGRGGRNQEFALVTAKQLSGVAGFSLLAAGTDGTDGPTDVTGAFIDGRTIARARTLGLDPDAILENNDSYALFDALGDHVRTGPTGTNVMDVCIAIVN